MTNGRIIVCDDESHITLSISMKLKRAGFEVETASDGQVALEAVERDTPDMLITDYQMPRMDGLELCRELRSREGTRDLPIILLTAKGFELDEDGLTDELQFSSVVVKPFSPRELLRLVQEHLGAAATAAGRGGTQEA